MPSTVESLTGQVVLHTAVPLLKSSPIPEVPSAFKYVPQQTTLTLSKNPEKSDQIRWLPRFVHDVMHGVDIIMQALQPVLAPGGEMEAAVEAARDDLATGPAAVAESAIAVQPMQAPLEVVIHVSQITVLLPTSSKYALQDQHSFMHRASAPDLQHG